VRVCVWERRVSRQRWTGELLFIVQYQVKFD